MNSTISSDEILRVEGLDLVFRARHYDQRSLRDSFVEFVRSPLKSVVREESVLHVLKNIDLTARRGDRVALLGVNGSGKTSLCRAIAGILAPKQGTVAVQGIRRALFNSQVCIIPELTGRENGHLLARFLYPEEGREGLSEIVSEALAFSELREFLDVPYETYSQGMKSRLYLSLVTAKVCDLLILDEVYDNADEFFRAKMLTRFQLFIDGASVVIFVSHSAEYLRQVCNRAVVLHESRIVFDGSVEEGLKVYRFLNAPSRPN